MGLGGGEGDGEEREPSGETEWDMGLRVGGEGQGERGRQVGGRGGDGRGGDGRGRVRRRRGDRGVSETGKKRWWTVRVFHVTGSDKGSGVK